jgi:hypothetical protein
MVIVIEIVLAGDGSLQSLDLYGSLQALENIGMEVGGGCQNRPFSAAIAPLE